MWYLSSVLLCVLTIQRSGASILLHDAGSSYSTALAVLLGEGMKQIICFIVGICQYRNQVNIKLPTEHASSKEKFEHLLREYQQAFWLFIKQVKGKDALRVLLPASLYVLQNNLFLYASGRLPPSTFQALWQLRLIPTACFSQVMLSKYLSLRQWIALVIILAGVICIQQKSPLPSLTSITVDETAAQDYIRMSAIGAVIIAALLASFAGVYLERIFKEENTNLWVANFQLSSFSIAPALVVFIIECSRNNNDYWTPFAAFSSSYWPWITVLIHGCAGIMVALTTKYAGCIAGSISGVASIAFTHLVDITRHSNASLAKETKFFAGFVLVSIGVGSYIYFGRLEKLEHPSNINYKNQDEAIAQEEGLLTMQTMESKVDSNEDDQLPVYEPISGHSTSTATSIPSVH